MRCKIITVPIELESAPDRERKFNDFLNNHNVKRMFASVANSPQGPVWSVMFMYEETALEAMGTVGTTTAVAAGHVAEVSANPAQPAGPNRKNPAREAGPALTREQVKWIIALKRWRTDQAAEENVPLYMVAQNKWLEEIVRMPARGVGDLRQIPGMGEWRVQKYGAKILEILNATDTARRAWPSNSAS